MPAIVLRLALLAALVAGVVLFHRKSQEREPRIVAAARDKILLIGNGTEVETLDPDLATGMPEHKVISALFEGLIAPGTDDPDEDAPGAAASWTHEAFTRWTFKLRPEGKWSDGTPLTAHDFVFAYQRILSPDFAADYAPMLYPMLNAEAFNKGELQDFAQVGVKAADDLTLEIQQKGPTPYLTGILEHYTWFAVPKHAVLRHGKMTDRLNPWTKPANIVSNGPFKLKAWRFTHYLSVDRNPHYWDAATVKLREIRFFPIASDTTEERAFQDGQLHMTDTVPITRIPFYKGKTDGSYHADLNLGTQFIKINVTRKTVADPRVRQALSLALDRKGLVTHVLRAGQLPCHGLTPPGCADGYETPNLIRFDVAAARKLLAEAGYPEGRGFPKIELLITQSSSARMVAEAVQEMWKKNLGIQVGILNQEWQVYLDAMRKLEYDFAIAGWVGDYPDPSTFLNLWRSGDGNNNTGYASAEYDKLVNTAEVTTDLGARMKMLQDAETQLLQDMPIVPIFWRVHCYLQRPQVKHYKSSLMEHRTYKVIDLEAE